MATKTFSLSFVTAFLAFASLPALADDSTSLAPGDALAQDDEEESDDDDDFLDDLLSEDPGGNSQADDIKDLNEGNIEDRVGVGNLVLPEDDARRQRVIKTIQKKNFLKLGRFELSPHLAFVTNDPFLNRYIGGIGLGYHVTEIFEFETSFDFSPDLGETDWKPLTKQLVENNQVSPDISKLTYFGSASFIFSPIYGKVALSGKNIINFDIFGNFGMGFARTADDLNALGEDDARALSTQYQIHPTTNFGGGTRIIFSENVALRIEGRTVVYIETVNGTTLEMKQNFLLQSGISFFFPGMRD